MRLNTAFRNENNSVHWTQSTTINGTPLNKKELASKKPPMHHLGVTTTTSYLEHIKQKRFMLSLRTGAVNSPNKKFSTTSMPDTNVSTSLSPKASAAHQKQLTKALVAQPVTLTQQQANLMLQTRIKYSSKKRMRRRN